MAYLVVTGGTGTLGLGLVRELFKGSHELHLIIRAKDESHFKSRSRHLLTHFKPSNEPPNLFFHWGDVTQGNMGLSEEEFKELTKNCEHFVHCAGEVKLNQSRKEALTNNVDAIKNVVRFCQLASESKNFKKLDVVTTVGVGGKTTRVLNEEFLKAEPEFHNNYEYGKFQVEKYLKENVINKMPVTIHRPSMIVGNSKTGEANNFQVFYHLCEFMAGRRTHGLTPAYNKRTLDIIPIDTVIQGMKQIIFDPDSAGKIYNSSTGPELSLGLTAISEAVKSAYKKYGVFSPANLTIPSRLTSLLSENRENIDGLIQQLQSVASGVPLKGLRKKLSAMGYILDYLETDQSFENKNFKAVLARGGLEVPKPESYLTAILDFYIQSKYGFESDGNPELFVKEVQQIEFFRDKVWPLVRPFTASYVSERCTKCGISANYSPLENGICEICRHPQPEEKVVPEVPAAELDLMIHEALQKRAPLYDAVVLFSGGKDSTFLVDRLKEDYPNIRLLALSVDNTFMSPIALENIKKVVKRLNIDHQTVRPKREMMRKMFSYALTHLNSKGCSGTVDQFDGDFIHDTARNVAASLQVPLVFSGLSKAQVETVLELESFCHPLEFEASRRTEVAGITLSDVFNEPEMKWWWDGTQYKKKDIPRIIYPFYVWNIKEEEIKKEVVSKGYIEDGNQSPLLTNNQLIPLMGIVDMVQLGYSSFEPEFCKNVRRGTSDYEHWRNTFEIVEFAARTGLLISSSIDDLLAQLGLTREELKLPTRLNLGRLPEFVISKVSDFRTT